MSIVPTILAPATLPRQAPVFAFSEQAVVVVTLSASDAFGLADSALVALAQNDAFAAAESSLVAAAIPLSDTFTFSDPGMLTVAIPQSDRFFFPEVSAIAVVTRVPLALVGGLTATSLVRGGITAVP